MQPFNYYFPATYQNPYLQQVPQMPQIQQPQPQQPQANQTIPSQQASGPSINWVRGEAAANSFPCGPGCSVFLLDSEENKFYIRSTDTSGMSLPLRTFTYTEKKAEVQSQAPVLDTPEYVTKDELEKRLADFQNQFRQGKNNNYNQNGGKEKVNG